MPMPRNKPEDVWKGIDQRSSEQCWPWLRSTNSHGYGEMRLDDRHVLAHRLVFQLATGVDPGSLFVCHTCDNRRCCNPTHLFLGTNRDNLRDCSAKGRTARGECHGRSKLVTEQVREMRELYAAGATFVQLGALYGVTPENASYICRRETWRHVA